MKLNLKLKIKIECLKFFKNNLTKKMKKLNNNNKKLINIKKKLNRIKIKNNQKMKD